MSIDQDELQEPQAPGMDEAAWSGAALTFTREDGGQPGPGGLSDRVRLPGQHLHPARRAAAEKLRAAEAKRDALQAEIAARGPERDALQKLWWESQGPERDAVDEELDRHDRRTRRLTEGLPYAEADVRNAWAALASAYWASDGEQKDYVYQRAPELLTQLQAFAEGFQHVAAELQQLVELLHGKNIIHMGQPQTGAEQDARFARD
jgi:hypothetical protein